MTTTTFVGARIGAARECQGIELRDLASALEMSASNFAEVEAGTKRLDISEVVRVASLLSTTVHELLGIPELVLTGTVCKVVPS
jgi:transcriptional regulator with XRE-family HTH domain